MPHPAANQPERTTPKKQKNYTTTISTTITATITTTGTRITALVAF